MSEKIVVKRSTRITFLGCCNLPQQKAFKLRDDLQTIILYVSDLHAACDDDKIKVDDKHKILKDLTSLSAVLQELTLIGKDQVDLCESMPAIHASLVGIYSRIKSTHEQTKQLFSKIGASVQGMEKNTVQAVDSILAMVRDTVELLRIADQYTITRVENTSKELAQQASAVANARDVNQLLEFASPLARLSVDLAKIVQQRAAAIDVPQVKETLEIAAGSVAKHVPALIMAVRSSIGTKSAEVENHEREILNATHEISKALAVAPEFAVLFEVNYVDTEFAAKLAALAAAVKDADPISVSKHSKSISADVAKQVKAASADKAPAAQEKCKNAQNATARVLDTAKEALATRMASDVAAPAYIAKEADLNKSITALQEAVAALPATGHQNSTTHLIKAAQDLSAKLHLLLAN